ncbi:MAG: radical SAM/SPASM domain-containing protein [Elusimicrobiota bacterium]
MKDLKIKTKIKNKLQNFPRLFKVLKKTVKTVEVIFYSVRYTNLNYFLSYISALLKTRKSFGKPILATIEPANFCNLNCPICETGCGELSRKPRAMSLNEYKTIIDQFDKNLIQIYLYFMGEPFLIKDIYKMIRYSADRGIYVSTCTNGETVDPEKLVKSGIADVQFQIGGMSQQTHEVYRKNGNLKKALDNLRKTVELKRKYREKINKEKYSIKVGVGFIIMKHNEHEQQEFIDTMKNVGIDEYQVISPAVRNIPQAKVFFPKDRKYWLYDEKEYEMGKLAIKNPYDNYCEHIYSTVTIQVNGDVVPCCRDPKGEHVLGNVFKENIYAIWNNKKYRELRRIVTSKKHHLPLCDLCSGYPIPDIKK